MSQLELDFPIQNNRESLAMGVSGLQKLLIFPLWKDRTVIGSSICQRPPHAHCIRPSAITHPAYINLCYCALLLLIHSHSSA